MSALPSKADIRSCGWLGFAEGEFTLVGSSLGGFRHRPVPMAEPAAAFALLTGKLTGNFVESADLVRF